MPCRYRFEDFEFADDPPTLARGGQPVAASSRVLALIGCLLEAGGQVVDKTTLLDRVWGHRHLTDAALARVVMHARRALGDDGQAQRIIRTAHGQGFLIAVAVERVVAEPASIAPVSIAPASVDAEPAPATDVPARTAAGQNGPSPARRLRLIGATVFAVLALTVLVSWWGANGSRDGVSAGSDDRLQERVVVLRSTADEDEELVRIAALVPELLSDRLAALGLRVVAAEPGAVWPPPGEGALGALNIQLERSPGGVRARVIAAGSAPALADSALVLEAPDTASMLQQLAYAMAAQLAGQGDQALSGADDPLVEELELRARIAWSRGRAEDALRALDAALALDDTALGLQLLRYEIALAEQASPAQILEEFLARIDAEGDRLTPLQRATLLQRAGRHAWFAGDAEAAERLLQPALLTARRAGAPLTEALVLNSLSQAQQSKGHFEEAWESAQLSIELLREGNHAYHLALALTNLGYMAEDRGQLALSGRLHREALDIRTAYGFERQIAASQYGLARVERRSGELAAAAERVAAAADAMARTGQRLDRISALEELAVIERLRGRFEASERALDRAEDLARAMDDGLGLAWLMDVRGRLRMAEGRPDAALPLLRESFRAQRQHGEVHESRYTQLALLDALRRVLAGRGVDDPTGFRAQRAETDELERTVLAQSGTFTQNQRSALAVVQLRHAAASAEPTAAVAACRDALAIARNAGALDHEAEAALECARAHRRAGDPAAAERMNALAEAWSAEWYAWAAGSRNRELAQTN